MADWYYIGNYGQLGPLTREQMDELIEGGVIARDTYVWRAGMPQWVTADTIADLASSFAKSMPMSSPPPPPMPQVGTMTPPAAPPPGFTNTAYQPYGSPNAGSYAVNPYTPMPLGMVKSNKSRVTAGILQILLPGVGRIYLGYAAYGVMQLVLTLCTGVLWIWSIIDGIIMLTGGLKLDGYGRVLED